MLALLSLCWGAEIPPLLQYPPPWVSEAHPIALKLTSTDEQIRKQLYSLGFQPSYTSFGREVRVGDWISGTMPIAQREMLSSICSK